MPPYHVHRQAHTRIHTYFCDTAEIAAGFRAGVVGAPGCYHTQVCPPWVSSLQQAEVYAAFWAVQLALYEGARSVAIGVDNDAARAQLGSISASTACRSQQQILRKFFWLRMWSNVQPSFFQVPTGCNLADPLSRIHGFSRWSHVTAAVERRRQSWGMSHGALDGLKEASPSARVNV